VLFCVVSCNYKEEPALAQRAANSIVKGLHHIRISSVFVATVAELSGNGAQGQSEKAKFTVGCSRSQKTLKMVTNVVVLQNTATNCTRVYN